VPFVLTKDEVRRIQAGLEFKTGYRIGRRDIRTVIQNVLWNHYVTFTGAVDGVVVFQDDEAWLEDSK